MGKTWVTSDLHLNHKNILQLEHYCLFQNGYSYLQTIEDYNKMIINNLNNYVKPDDTLYILGDFAFGGTDVVKNMVSQINGHKILVMGNHDKYSPIQAKSLGFNDAMYGPIYAPGTGGKVLMSHYPPKEGLDNDYLTLVLHGHLHASKVDLPKFINVNISMNGYKPIDLDKILEEKGNNAKSRAERWLQEWYAEYQIFLDRSRTDVPLLPNGKIDFETLRGGEIKP